jgi:hypothetical protein
MNTPEPKLNEEEDKQQPSGNQSQPPAPHIPESTYSPQHLEELRRQFEQHRPLAELFVGGFNYRMVVDPRVETFSFEHESKTVRISPGLIEKYNLKDVEQRYVFMHELGHFWQLLSSPESYKRTFEVEREKADEYAREHGQGVKQPVKKLFGIFYNIMLDVHANSRVDNIAPFTRGGVPHVKQGLYKKIAEPTDMTKSPLTNQFLWSLMRTIMVPNGAPMVVSERVRQILNKPVKILGKAYSSIVHYASHKLQDVHVSFTDICYRINRFLLPVFEELLKEDLENAKKQAKQPQDGTNPGELGDLLPFDGDITDEMLEKAAEEIMEDRESSDKKMEKRMEDAFSKDALEKGFTPQQIARMKEIMASTTEVYQDLKSVWSYLCERLQMLTVSQVGGFYSGSGVDIPEFIKELPLIPTGASQMRVFTRQQLSEQAESWRPKKIRIIQVIDLSGSMSEKMKETVQEVLYAVAKSLIQFRRDVAMKMKDEEAEPIQLDLKMWGYGTNCKEIFPKTPQEEEQMAVTDDEKLDQRLWQTVLALQGQDFGGTNSHKPLQQVLEYLQQSAQNDADDAINIVIEITDGATSQPETSARIVQHIQAIPHVHAGGILIPQEGFTAGPKMGKDGKQEEEEDSERNMEGANDSFRTVWGNKGQNLRNLSDLKKAILSIIADAVIQQNH